MEKRNFKRINANVEIKFQVIEDSLAKVFYSGTKNFSSEGVCFISFNNLEIASTIRIEFIIPELNKAVIAKGMVAWTRKLDMKNDAAENIYEIGVHLLDLNEADKIAINKHVMLKV